MTDHTLLLSLIPGVAGCGFAALWFGISFGISRMGWHAFATRYPAASGPSGRFYVARSARFANVFASYRNAVRVAFLPEGIHFRVLFLFRPGHDPFTLPWSSVVRAEHEPGLIVGRYEIDIDDVAGRIRMWLAPAVETAVKEYLPQGVPRTHTPPI